MAKTQRDTMGIRIWMLRNEVRFADIRRDLELADVKQIRLTVKGERNHRRTLAWLRGKGCPERLLALPQDMREAA